MGQISVEHLQQLLAENEKNHELLLLLLEQAGVSVKDKWDMRGEICQREVSTDRIAAPEFQSDEARKKWMAIEEILTEEIADFEENAEELRSLKYLCREKEEYKDLEVIMDVSGEIIRHLQQILILWKRLKSTKQEKE